MRGCLMVLAGGVVFLAVLTWVALPVLAGAVISAGLATAGLGGTGTSVVVTASPPYEILDLHADSVAVSSSDVSWRGIDATSLQLVLRGVDLGARSAEAVTGRLDDATVTTSDGIVAIRRIDLAGPSTRIGAVLSIDPATAAALATRSVESAIKKTPTSVQLIAPDRIAVVVDTARVEGTLAIDPRTGAIVVDLPPLGHVVLTQPSTGLPFLLGSVAVTSDGGLTLTGTLDAQALGLSR